MRLKRINDYRLEVTDYIDSDEPKSFQNYSFFTNDGKYIGGFEEMANLVVNHHINHFECLPGATVCQIGLSDIDQTWYGWSHRAIYGFRVGSEVKKGDIAYNAPSKEEWIEDQLRFWESNSYEELITEDGKKGIFIDTGGAGVFCEFPTEFGKGEWTARTLADARDMAIDFARGVE